MQFMTENDKGQIVDAYPLKELAKEIHATAVDKGWWDADRNVGEVISNIHDEVSEAWKEYVHNHGVDETYYTMKITPQTWDDIRAKGGDVRNLSRAADKFVRFHQYLHSDGSEYSNKPEEPTKQEVTWLVMSGILEPHGFPTELADILIRVLDLFDAYGLDADEVVREKMLYNLTRKHRHGGKRA